MGKPTPCFMSGARIRAARGDVDIGAIVPGQEVVVVRDGRQVLEPVKWVGYSRIDLSQHANPEEAAPVRFRAGAIAVQQPLRDLVVSPEHCLIIDDLCVPAKLLVNGGSIVSERDHPPFTYFHLDSSGTAFFLPRTHRPRVIWIPAIAACLTMPTFPVSSTRVLSSMPTPRGGRQMGAHRW